MQQPRSHRLNLQLAFWRVQVQVQEQEQTQVQKQEQGQASVQLQVQALESAQAPPWRVQSPAFCWMHRRHHHRHPRN